MWIQGLPDRIEFNERAIRLIGGVPTLLGPDSRNVSKSRYDESIVDSAVTEPGGSRVVQVKICFLY